MISTFSKWVMAVLRSSLANSWIEEFIRREFALVLTPVVQMFMKFNMLIDCIKVCKSECSSIPPVTVHCAFNI